MKVVLFRDMEEPIWPSMRLYAEKLLQYLPIAGGEDLEMASVRPRWRAAASALRAVPKVGWLFDPRYYTKFLYYPLKARFSQGDVNHVTDHSNGQLLYGLDPERTVVTCNDLIPLFSQSKRNIDLKLWDLGLRAVGRAARIIAISRKTREDVLNYLGCRPEQVPVIYYGIDEIFRPVQRPGEIRKLSRMKYGLEEKDIVFFHPGSNCWQKNIETLLEVIACVGKKTGRRAVLLKAGSPLSRTQAELAGKLGLSRAVRYPGFMPQADLPSLYYCADVLLFPSLYEGFGLPPLEAMACGIPAVTSRAPALLEAVGKAALTREAEDTEGFQEDVLALLEDHEMREMQVRKGFERAKRFNWKRTAQETLKVYREIRHGARKPDACQERLAG